MSYASVEFLDRVFPFHLALDQELKLTSVGRSAHKLSEQLKPGAFLRDVLRPVAPRTQLSRDNIERQAGRTFLCALIDSDLKLRGQMVVADDGDGIVFLCTPWLSKPEELTRFGLTQKDFAPHETAIEHLHLTHTRTDQLRELNELNATVQNTLAETRRLMAVEDALKRDLQVAADLRVRVCEGKVAAAFFSNALQQVGRDVDVGLELAAWPDWLRDAVQGATNDGAANDSNSEMRLTLNCGQEHRVVEIRVSRMGDDDVIVLGRDVTQAQEEHLLLFATLENAMEAVIMIDDAHQLTFFNKAAEDLFGVTKAQALGKHVDMLQYRRRKSDLPLSRHWALAEDTDNQQGELELTTRDERRIVTSFSVSRVQVGRNAVVAAFIQDVTDQRLAQRRINYQANHDELTGLPNRFSFLRTVNDVLGGDEQRQMAVALIDMDNFKAVNDLLGHSAGDRFLRTTADRITQTLREYDTACRLGGDEFAVILMDIPDVATGVAVMRKVLDALRQPMTIESVQWVPTASIGVALSGSVKTAADLLRNADLAMYEAKAHGKGRVHCYTPALTTRTRKRIEMQRRLEAGLERGEIQPHFQPVVDLSTGQISSFEALARWFPRDGDPVPPDQFIPIAENSELIVRLEDEIIHRSMDMAKRFRSRYAELADLRVNINISPRHFAQPDLLSALQSRLETYKLAPNAIMLELTESTLLNDTRMVQRQFDALRDLGIGIALDDFGTGYSSLSYLEKFRFDVMKIDQSFVRGVSTQQVQRRLTEIIIAVSQVMDIAVVAEGIETVEDEQVLKDLDCGYGQGYYYARPLAIDDIDAFLEAWGYQQRPQLIAGLDG